eukprot:TRINITY_DN14492_c0_g1_i1.p2 TRINITY_DN14492_c0_g1~~TRINITY_DN14492_c0_g1_i1.p2  ORF type:complete len:175 (+),score=50.95 TRINITY_DN14492_c0_g1_i1:45-569(+)
MAKMFGLAGVLVFVAMSLGPVQSLKKGECEVCLSVLNRFKDTLSKEEASQPPKIEAAFKKYCKNLKTKEDRFCYFLGGTADAATGILGEMSKPMSWGMPAEKICEKLKKKDRQICELTYEKQIDFKTIDLKKLKVKDLKKILNDWDETCDGCLEKGDFIKRIEELKPKYVRDEL